MVKHLYVVKDKYTVHFWHFQRPKRTKQKTAFLLKAPESLDFDSEYYCLCACFVCSLWLLVSAFHSKTQYFTIVFSFI